nr:hypothetical protein [Tanacetum cinerariifolium]
NPHGDRVLRSNSHGKKLEVEEHRRNVKLPKNKMSVTACNDNLNAKTLNVKSVSAMCAKCLIEIVLFIVNSGCSKHMMGNLKLLINFVEKFLGTVKFGNNQIAPILGYGDLNDIVVGLPKLKFIKDHLCSSCELGKAKRKSFHSKLTPSSTRRLHLLHMDLCGPMRVASINGKRYVLVHRGLQAHIRVVRTDKGTEFLNQTLHAYFSAEGIQHHTSVARTPEQNGVVERWNRTLVEAARTM